MIAVDAANFSSDGRAFQHVGPETGKIRSP